MKFFVKHSCKVFALVALFLNGLNAQEIKVEDKNSGESLEGVAIYTEDLRNSIQTDSNGKASLAGFSGVINFYLMGFEALQIQYSELEKMGNVIKLISKDKELDEVILSVARSQSTRNKIAEEVSIISARDIELSNGSTGADILESSLNVRIQKSQGGGGSPVLRGFEANRILIVVDGVRMNNAIYRSGHLQNAITIDPHNIERVEVTFGSSSVGYGSDALGGVIHYYSKSPVVNGAKKVTAEYTSNFNYANLSSVNNLNTKLSFNNWGSLTSFSFSHFGDIKIGKNRRHGFENWGLTPYYSINSRENYYPTPLSNSTPNTQKNTGYDQYDLFQKLIFALPRDMVLNVNFQYSESTDINRYDKLAEERAGSLRFSEWYYGPQKRLFISPQLKVFFGKNWLQKGTFTAAYQNIEESRINRKFGSITRSYQNENVDIFSFNADFNGSLNDKHSISYGIEGTQNKIASNGFSKDLILDAYKIIGLEAPTPIPSRYPNDGSKISSFAGYLNWVYLLNKKLTLNTGLRVTKSSLVANWNDTAQIDRLLSLVDLKFDAITYTLAVTYRPNERTLVSSLFSSGFRNPNIDDIGKIRESNGTLLVPNTFLDPEYAYTFESGVSLNSSNKKIHFDLRGYTTLVSRHIMRSDYIVFADQSTPDENTILYKGEEIKTQANKNLGNRFIYGGSIQTNYKLNKKITAMGSVTYTDSYKDLNYGPMPSISPIYGTLSMVYDQKKLYAKIYWQFSGSKDPTKYSWGGEDGLNETPLINPTAIDDLERYNGTPSWSILSFLSQYQYRKNIKLNFGVTNIFDLHYRTFASGISSEGRSFRLGLKVKI